LIFGTGVDIIEVERIEKTLRNDKYDIISGAFTPNEITYCRSRKNEAEIYAGFFAAKEAFLKALGTGWRYGISWSEITVRYERKKYILSLSGEAASRFSCNKIKKIHLSINTTKQAATAVVILEK
jgi:holo-[acyl-carrier protein] synthase